jgi:hypothetical protein
MSILEEYEEISFSDESTQSTEGTLKSSPMKISSKKYNISKFHKLKSNPDTFDYECLLKQMKRPGKFGSASPPVVDRLLFSHQLSQNRKNFLLQKKECEEKKSCTFRPSILGSKKQRTFQDFYQEQQLFLSKKREKIENLREFQEKTLRDSEIGFRKKACMSPGSKVIMKKYRAGINECIRNEVDNVFNTAELFKRSFKKAGRLFQ